MWVISRLFSSLVVLIVVSMMLFVLCRATPVSPAVLSLGADASPDQVAEFDERYGLNRPVWVQYRNWLSGAVRLDFGESYVTGVPIAPQITRTLPVTFELVTISFIVTVLASVVLGVLGAFYEDRLLDHGLRILAITGLSIPGFWLALLMVRYLSVDLEWFPPGGVAAISSNGFLQHARSLVLPVVAISFYYIAFLSRLVRTSVIDAMSQDYIRTAEAMGLPRRKIWFYALRNALPPLASMAAMIYGYMYGWALIVEQVFSIPGVSRELLASIFQRDYPAVQAIVLIITIIFIASNTAADVLQRAMNPNVGGAK